MLTWVPSPPSFNSSATNGVASSRTIALASGRSRRKPRCGGLSAARLKQHRLPPSLRSSTTRKDQFSLSSRLPSNIFCRLVSLRSRPLRCSHIRQTTPRSRSPPPVLPPSSPQALVSRRSMFRLRSSARRAPLRCFLLPQTFARMSNLFLPDGPRSSSGSPRNSTSLSPTISSRSSAVCSLWSRRLLLSRQLA